MAGMYVLKSRVTWQMREDPDRSCERSFSSLTDALDSAHNPTITSPTAELIRYLCDIQTLVPAAPKYCSQDEATGTYLVATYPNIVRHRKKVVPCLHAVAADYLLLDEENWMESVKVLKAAILLEKSDSIMFDKDPPNSDLHSLGNEVNRLGWRFVKHCGSKRDVVVYVDKKIPCSCLTDLKKKVMKEPEIRTCGYCQKHTANTMWCEECHAAEYCSKQCQLADWPDHQDPCKFLGGELTEEES
ncbi:unknown protein [Seminavis robusta]|uniref:MYND-type domain-containing protein n=1 Tax=Seminavis robusta TaxID=568900 RepID=A0A9N8H4B2_9STRA|nr:unknown protein [Seminavis robusta]|eukprot:Sro45_g026960.1 n/a (244) ;mRNA; f:80765-81705